METILITGGAGFIGSNFIRHILNKYKEYKIINLDKLTYCGNLDNLKDIEKNPRYKFVKGDVCDKEVVSKLIKNSDFVIHFAAETHVDRSISDASPFIQTDVFGTYNLLNIAKDNKIKRFIQISTDEVYGSIKDGKFKETDELKPSNPYSASKASADRIAYSFYATYNLPVIITRSSNNFGPFQYPEKLIPLFITNLLEGKKVPVYGDGLNIRDWLYVLDNCEAIDFILHKGKEGEVYNIAGNNERTNIEITKLLLELLNKNENSLEYVKDRPGHDRRYALNSDKLNKLGWNPKPRFKEAIKNTVNWYTQNQEWWKKVRNKSFYDYYKKQYKG